MSTDLIFTTGMITGALILTSSYLLVSYLERKRK